jgi:hypothetical protein
LFGVALGLLALTTLSWPIRAMARRSHKTPFPYEGPRAQSHRLAAAGSFLSVLYICGWIGFVLWLMESLTSNSGGTAPALLTVLYVAGLLPVLALAGVGYANFALWKAPSTWFARIWGVLVLLSIVVILWFAAVMNLFSFHYNY